MLGTLRRPTPTLLAAAASLVALGFGCYQLAQPHVLVGVLDVLGYDDGVYSGVSIRLVHGAVPYRDFVYVHPPGMAVLLAPPALVGMATSTHVAVVADRILTVAVTALNPLVAGLLVRRLGRAAVGVTAFALALWPITVGTDRGTGLEPFLVLFVLAGSAVIFSGVGAPSRSRLLTGGLLLGTACSVKLWGFLAAGPALAVAVTAWRGRARWLLAGLAAGFLAVCLPFFLLAPHAFWHDVVVDQLGRQKATPTPFVDRLRLIAGLDSIDSPPTVTAPGWLVGAGFATLAGATVWLFAFAGRRSALEWYVASAAVVTFLGMLASPVNTDFYVYFPMCLIAPLVGVATARLWALLRTGRLLAPAGRRLKTGLSLLAGAGLMALAVDLGAGQASFDRTYLAGAWEPSALSRYIPGGSCVLTSFPPVLTITNRFVSTRPGCPTVLDPFGMYLAEDNGNLPHSSPPYQIAFASQWLGYLEQADYLVVVVPFSDFIPWEQYSVDWFKRNYALVATLRNPTPTDLVNDSAAAFYIYRHVS